ncbi:MAG: histidine phosphatase family protein [Eubacteriaceae bacterium]|nr:histidine phosphatase family protein [Eubacteriaceae bacterium]
MNLYIARHGTTQWNLDEKIQGCTDTELSEIGIQEAEMLRPKISSLGISKIYTSPLKRAKKTAEIFNKEIHVPLIEVQDLREIQFGEWEGLTWPQVSEKYADLLQDMGNGYVNPPGGEDYQTALSRVGNALKSIIDTNKESCLIVSHKATIRFMFYYLLGKTPLETGIIEIPNLQLLHLVIEDGKPVSCEFL